MQSELDHFGSAIAKLGLIEADLASALIWYRIYVDGATEVSAASLATTMQELALKGQINVSRLSARLAAHKDTVRGQKPRTFKIKLSSLDKMTEKYEPLLERPKPKVTDHILPASDFKNTRRYLERMVEQINGCYQFAYFDGCAVLCRRLMETLLIEVFEVKKLADQIKANGDYVALSEIISQARNGQHFKLARGTGDILDLTKDIGDTAAHNRTYMTSPKDIDDLKVKFRRMISELMHLAAIESK